MNQPKSHSHSITGVQSVSHDGCQGHHPAAAAATNHPITSSQHLHDLNKSTSAYKAPQPQHVIQFDLVKQDLPEFKPHFGRKKGAFAEEATCVKDVF